VPDDPAREGPVPDDPAEADPVGDVLEMDADPGPVRNSTLNSEIR